MWLRLIWLGRVGPLVGRVALGPIGHEERQRRRDGQPVREGVEVPHGVVLVQD
jgi:hypothetical protein